MNHSDLHHRASALFVQLRQLPQEQRAGALVQAAGDDAVLREEVESLLAYDVPDAFRDGAPSLVPRELPTQIGPYRIVSLIGHGGSGQVFLAEQLEPIRRRVAVKIVPQAAVSSEIAARFEVERRALECADHPNIARVLDAGRTSDGVPYLVMDYVEGATITEYCQQHRLDVIERIGLMLEVADAVQHVHQLGVVHRDLKPANILVTEVDGRPTPRVIDFGIAKPMTNSFAGDSPPTSGLPLGTPAYMAPEQTGLQPVDTRADIYALGAVLYELIAGQPPIDTAGDPLDVLRRIREQVPPPASRVRARMPHKPDLPRRVPASMLADLDCILGKSLERSPDRRYPSASAWADDLRRLLRYEPIEARRPTFGYRVARFAQRNRALVASAIVIVLAIALGMAGLTAGLIEANRQRQQAMVQTKAQLEINRFLTDDLLAAASPEEMGSNVSALDLLHRASRRIEHRFQNQPLIAASVHHTLGTVYAQLSAFDESERHLSKAIELRQAFGGEDSPDAVRSELALAALLVHRQRYEEGERALTMLMDRARSILGPDDPALYTALDMLGVARETLGKLDEALPPLQEALEGRLRLLGPEHHETLKSMGNLASLYDSRGEVNASMAMMHEALAIAEALPEPPRMVLLTLNNNIGATYQDLSEDAKAQPYLQKALELAEHLLGPSHPATLTIKGNVAGLEADLGDPERAAAMYAQIIELRTAQFGANTYDTLTLRHGYWSSIWKTGRFDEAAAGFASMLPDAVNSLGKHHWLTAQTRHSLAKALFDAGQIAEALQHALQAEADFRTIFGPDHSRTRNVNNLIDAIHAKLRKPQDDEE